MESRDGGVTMRKRIVLLSLVVGSVVAQGDAFGQSFGTELHNTMMPASGAMGGTSIARPQDLASALNANPAALTQFRGTQFMVGGGFVGPTMNLTQTSQLPVIGPDPLVQPFSAKSSAPGTPLVNFGVTQDLGEVLGFDVVFGTGMVTTAGAAADYRHVPQSNGTNSSLLLLNAPASLGVQLTDRWSVGSTMSLGIAYYDGPFVGVGGMTPDYALRGTLGTNYQLTEATTVGGYYQTQQKFTFDNAVSLNFLSFNPTLDVNMDLPENLGFGVANSALFDGRLLVAMDLVYKLWEDAAMYDAVYDNQLVVQVGTQWTQGRYRWRAGYAWAENPLDPNPKLNLGGVTQIGGVPAVYYSQSLLAITCQNRLSMGVGISDVLPGIDLDLMGGGMFFDSEQLGPFTNTSLESYWISAGLTWRFRRGSSERVSAPDTFTGPNVSAM
jgi:long-chain fatty acid transport protein